MNKIIKYATCIAVALSFSICVCFSAFAYDETVVTTAPLDAVQMYRSDGMHWAAIPFSVDSDTYYRTYTVPPVTAVKFVFTVSLDRTFKSIQVQVPYDFSGLPSFGTFSVVALYRGVSVPANIINNGTSVTINASTDAKDLSNSMQFDVTVWNVNAETGNQTSIYWGRSATVSYDVVFDNSEDLNELNSADAALNEHMSVPSDVSAPDVEMPTEQERNSMTWFMDELWKSLKGFQIPIILSVTLGALGFILSLKGGSGSD